jgi:pyruvate-ferredoxin/flavodoxin oxidoreductase
VPVPRTVTSRRPAGPVVPDEAPEFVRHVTAPMIAGRGDELPVSAIPADGTYPSGTSRWEKRNIADAVPVWSPELCVQCGNCVMVCPHASIRARQCDGSVLADAPSRFASAALVGRGFPNQRFTIQVAVEDCTGCELCVEACPVRSGEDLATRALAMRPKDDGLVSTAREHFAFFSSLPDVTPAKVDSALVRGAQFLTPLFEYSGACAGCGETPYLRLLTQLFGDRLLVANATGCSSIYGGNLPTTPWSFNKDGRGPAWSNSLFEDNAEFGLGYRVSIDKHRQQAEELLTALVNDIGPDLVQELRNAPQVTAAEIDAQRSRVGALDRALAASIDPRARQLRSLAGYLVRKTVWIVGGDGWAYDIGYGGLDHVLASGRNVNLLVLDTEVYSNTGGQASKATPRGSVARFAAGGKQSRKKDLGLMAMGYGNVYVAQIAMGASPQQTLDALREAEMHEGPSLVIAYGHCIAHGIDMRLGLRQQKLAVDCGHWPLYRFRPAGAGRTCEEFVLDSLPPSIPFQTYAYNEIRYRMLADSRPEEAERLLALAQEDVHHRWQVYKDLARRWPVSPGTAPQTPRDATA